MARVTLFQWRWARRNIGGLGDNGLASAIVDVSLAARGAERPAVRMSRSIVVIDLHSSLRKLRAQLPPLPATTIYQ